MLIPLIYNELKFIITKNLRFEVTTKRYQRKGTFIETLKEMKTSLIFNSIAIIGIIRNPIYILFNFIWLIPFLFSPLLIYISEKSNTNLPENHDQ
jgi:hypothetical protein